MNEEDLAKLISIGYTPEMAKYVLSIHNIHYINNMKGFNQFELSMNQKN